MEQIKSKGNLLKPLNSITWSSNLCPQKKCIDAGGIGPQNLLRSVPGNESPFANCIGSLSSSIVFSECLCRKMQTASHRVGKLIQKAISSALQHPRILSQVLSKHPLFTTSTGEEISQAEIPGSSGPFSASAVGSQTEPWETTAKCCKNSF